MQALSYEDRRVAEFILALGALPGVGKKTVKKVLEEERRRIEGAATLDEGFAYSVHDPKVEKGLKRSEESWESLEQQAAAQLELAEERGVSVLHPYMASYPQRLLRNGNYPPLLFCLGDVAALNQEKAVAIVGTREPTPFGAKMARQLAAILAKDGYVIVSGLALGCDSAGHEGALDAGGKTVAVLATPPDGPVYPKENAGLAERIVEGGGALVSEYAPGTRVGGRQLAGNLVARDEWQPGLSDGVIAVETSVKGGTTHALKHAEKTRTPIAVFDYSSKWPADFRGDPRFGGNVEYLDRHGASPIFAPETIGDFERRMDAYRAGAAPNVKSESGQLGMAI